MKDAAEKFLAVLEPAQRTRAMLPFDSPAREDFRYTPRERAGLPLKEMDEGRRKAAMALLDTALSDRGRLKAMHIITLEGVLAELEGRPERRDPGRYYLAVFGTPGDAGGWGWRFEGHHLSLNYTVVGGKAVVTPHFMGANPATVRTGPHHGLRPLAAEEELARALALVLLEAGHKEVIFSDRPPGEILTAENRKAIVLETVGVAASKMNAGQKKALHDLISEYTGRHREALAEDDMRKIAAAGIGRIHFGWAGSIKPGEAFYYRVQGPTFLLECANTQNDANHIHTTWREFEGDFGRDLMKEHYDQHRHDGGRH
jgi:hypothetical protein